MSSLNEPPPDTSPINGRLKSSTVDDQYTSPLLMPSSSSKTQVRAISGDVCVSTLRIHGDRDTPECSTSEQTYTIGSSASSAPPPMQHRQQASSRSPRHSSTMTDSSEQHLSVTPRMSESLSSSSSSSCTGGANMLTDITQHYTHLCNAFQQMYHSGTLCDVVLSAGAGGGSIGCHRLVLAAASTYFAAMFTAGMQESHRHTIVMHDIEYAALQQLVAFCYTGKRAFFVQEPLFQAVYTWMKPMWNTCSLVGVSRKSSMDYGISLDYGACLLQMEPVVDMCTEFLTNQLHQSNCIGIRNFADQLGSCPKLRAAADNYAKEHFEQVMEQHEFVELPVEQVEALLQCDELNVACELGVLYALCRWISRNPRTRSAHAARLLSAVRLVHLTPEQISDHIEANPLFASAVCQRHILQALKYHLMPNRRSELLTASSTTLSRVRPRPSTVGTLFAIGGSDANRTPQSIEQYDNRSDTWHVVSRLPSRRLQFGCAVSGSKVYIAGGRDGLKTLRSFECWRPDRDKWEDLPSMMTPRHGLSVAFVAGPLYACGGHDGWAYLSTVERWDPETATWSYVAEMRRARASAGVAVIGTSLYMIGGRDSSQVLRCVECYDPHTNKWSNVAGMNRRRSGVGVAVLNSCIYAVGGMDAPSSNPQSASFASVERYDPRTDEWTLVASVSLGRDGIGVCPIGDRLMAVGGCHNSVCVNLVECYDEERNAWTKVCALQTGRAGTQVVLVPNRCPQYSIAHLPLQSSNRSPAGDKPPVLPKPTTARPGHTNAAAVQLRCQSPVDVDPHSYSI